MTQLPSRDEERQGRDVPEAGSRMGQDPLGVLVAIQANERLDQTEPALD